MSDVSKLQDTAAEGFIHKVDYEGLDCALTDYFDDAAYEALKAYDPQLAEDCLRAQHLLLKIEEPLQSLHENLF